MCMRDKECTKPTDCWPLNVYKYYCLNIVAYRIQHEKMYRDCVDSLQAIYPYKKCIIS